MQFLLYTQHRYATFSIDCNTCRATSIVDCVQICSYSGSSTVPLPWCEVGTYAGHGVVEISDSCDCHLVSNVQRSSELYRGFLNLWRQYRTIWLSCFLPIVIQCITQSQSTILAVHNTINETNWRSHSAIWACCMLLNRNHWTHIHEWLLICNGIAYDTDIYSFLPHIWESSFTILYHKDSNHYDSHS